MAMAQAWHGFGRWAISVGTGNLHIDEDAFRAETLRRCTSTTARAISGRKLCPPAWRWKRGSLTGVSASRDLDNDGNADIFAVTAGGIYPEVRENYNHAARGIPATRGKGRVRVSCSDAGGGRV